MTEDEIVGWHHRLDGREFEQVLGVGDAIQPSCPLLSTSPAFNLSQDQSSLMSWLFASDGQSNGASTSASVFPMNIQG